MIELKTEIVDIQELIGTFDRKRRLAREIAAERGLSAKSVSGWLIVAEGPTNPRRVVDHRSVLRAAFPSDGRRIARWVRRPQGEVSVLSFWSGPAREPNAYAAPRRVPAKRARSGRPAAR